MPEPMPAKVVKSAETARDKATDNAGRVARSRLDTFFAEQRARVVDGIRGLPGDKAARMKAQPTWWDPELEDAELRKAMADVYAMVGRAALQEVADTIGRIVFKGATQSVIADLLTYGGLHIKDINARTFQAITIELAEGTRRGYSISQLIEGVPDEGYRGVMGAGLDNGEKIWSDTRAETIARTESMQSYNRATVTGYSEFGITTLLAYDGDEDIPCAERDGQEFGIEEAMLEDELEHPNGTLGWSPVVDKSWHEPAPDPMVAIMADALKAQAQPMSLLAEALKAQGERPPQEVTVTPQIFTEPVTVDIEPLTAMLRELKASLMATKTIKRDQNGRIVALESVE